MKAMLLSQLGPLNVTSTPLAFADVPTPAPGRGELLVAVSACGVCHTELDEIEGRLPPRHLPCILGHQVVGRVVQIGEGVDPLRREERVGIGWIYCSSGEADENLSPQFRATGRDVPGGYAQWMTVPAAYAYPIPAGIPDPEAAPLLCGGAIGYRALKLSGLRDGEPLGLTGFGSSAHQVLQLTRYLFPRSLIYVFARDARTREFANSLGADWVGPTEAVPPTPLAAIIDTTPAWLPLVAALRQLKPGGRLVINAIRKEETDQAALLDLSYQE